MLGQPAEDQSLREKSVRLFTYLKEVTELRSKTVRTLDSYDKVIWLSVVPHAPGVFCAAWFLDPVDAPSDAWIHIGKPPVREPHPDAPAELEPWIDLARLSDSSRALPELLPRIVVEFDRSHAEPGTDDAEGREETFETLEQHPEIVAQWDAYVQESWEPWAENDRITRAAQEVYADLFSIYQRQQRLGEQYEVILALGLLNWRTPSSQLLRRHLFTMQVSVAFDPIRGALVVGPATEGSQLALEQEMLEPQERLDPVEQRPIEQRLAELGDAIWDKPQLDALLTSWAHAASARGAYNDGLIAPETISDDPVVSLAPAIILRKRTERSLIRVFDDIIEELSGSSEIPVGVLRLVDIVDDVEHVDEPDRERASLSTPPDELYFPLAANDEQAAIVERLHTRHGVLVQGPPGTGKSHTIANLVSHLLATGQRVLVTSHTPRALRVLHDKIPPEIAHLCVSLLGSDRAALQDLEDSVAGITNRYDAWDPGVNARTIAQLEQRLNDLREQEARLSRDLRSLREHETFVHALGIADYAGTAAAIALRVGQEAPDFSWMRDRPKATDDILLALDDVEQLLTLLRILTPQRLHEVSLDVVPSAELIPPEDFAALQAIESAAAAKVGGDEGIRSSSTFAIVAKLGADQRRDVANRIRQLLHVQDRLLGAPAWVAQAASHAATGRDRVWRELRDVTFQQLGAIGEKARETSAREIRGLDGRARTTVKADAAALLAHVDAGGGKGFGPFRASVVKAGKYLTTDVMVDGRPCAEAQPLQDLLAWIDVADRLEALRDYWRPYETIPPSPHSTQVAAYRDNLELLESALSLGDSAVSLQIVAALMSSLEPPPWQDRQRLNDLLASIELSDSADALERAGEPFTALSLQLSAAASGPRPVHPAMRSLAVAITHRDEEQYAVAYAIIGSIEAARRDVSERDALLMCLRAGAPHLAEDLEATAADSSWDDRVRRLQAAWDWARAEQWLEHLSSPEAHQLLQRDLANVRDQELTTLRDLGAAKAWRHFFTRLTESQRQHLVAWTYAMKRVGKGTGKHAGEHRRAARENLDYCRAAIPAWIMPIYRVAETIRPGRDVFDVVIVDEASQSGPDALFLQYIAAKVIVVGDDKQISPEFIGVNRDEVNVLRRRHLAGVPHNDALGLESSFFDQAAIRFGGRIRLREHFRCMPEIIQFSNNLCYQSDPLIPLRQYGADRLEPVRTTFVEGGYRQGTGSQIVNPPEAQAIVDQILQCCADTTYADASMGVISLQGDAQAKLIERELIEQLGPEEMERRKLTCGDAYDFQGDERDIVFLSLVAAPDDAHRIGTLSSDRDQRRFNVAASRAKNQMWLFHTAELHDLSSNCLRHQLLSYCQNPRVESDALEFTLPVDDRQVVAPFESLFEQRVFRSIRARGYRVTPQVKFAGYRIDLVVEGLNGRMAVECDGDQWHGPAQYDADMARQRQLERCGWTFWRVRGSSFFRDPDQAMEELWATLERLGIYPSVALQRAAIVMMNPERTGRLVDPSAY